MHINSFLQRLDRARIKLNCKLPEVQPQELLEGYENLRVRVPMVATHWETATLFDHVFIGSLVWALKPRVCFEIGTSLGLVTATIAANSPEGTEVHTLDLSNEERIGSYFREREEGRKIRQHFGPSSSFDYSLIEGRVDLMFIDGSHEAEDVIRDSENAFRSVSNRGVIVWHDVSPFFPGVIRALETLPQAGQIYRVHGTSCGVYAFPNAPLASPTRARATEMKVDHASELFRPEYARAVSDEEFALPAGVGGSGLRANRLPTGERP